MSALPVISEKHLAHGIASDLVAYCDPHDLIGIATDAHDVIVYRINGQVAFTVKRKDSDVEVTALGWKQDGSVLGVGWSDGTYGLYSGENGRVMSLSSVRGSAQESPWKLDLTPDFGGEDEEEDDGAVVTSFLWMRHQTGAAKRVTVADLAEEMGTLTTDDWYDRIDEVTLGGQLADDKLATNNNASVKKLARSIATMDVTTVLPRLSAIPAHGLRAGPEGSKFASQAATDVVFETTKDASTGDVDSLLVCSSDGSVRVLTDDTVLIGTCKVSPRPILQAAEPTSDFHTTLSQDQQDRLHANLIDLPLERLGSTLLHVIATNTKRIQNLLAYITHTIRCIQHDYTTGLQFPTRVMNNMQAELQEKQEGDLVTNLYHLAMTGHYTPTMHEWLTDIVKETNHKRWDQAVTAMYTHIQSHLFINLMPALDRLSIATTELRGQARFHEGRNKFEVSPDSFTKILDGIDSLRIVSQKMLLIIMAESRQFRAFSKWLRVMIDIGVAGPGTKGGNEVEEKENPNLDYPLLLQYIQHTMTRSKLARHIEGRPGFKGSCSSREEFLKMPEIMQMDYERTVEAVQKLDALKTDDELTMKEVQDADSLLNLSALAVYLSGNIRVALERITEWQSEMLSTPTATDLDPEPDDVSGPHSVLDVQMTIVKDASHSKHSIARLLLASGESRGTCAIWPLWRPGTQLTEPNSVDSPTVIEMNNEFADADTELLDAKFAGPDTSILLLRNGAGETSVIPRSLLQQNGSMRTAWTEEKRHVFPAQAGFKPEKLIVGGRQGKKVCVVFGNGGREWRALDLDSKPDVEGTTDDWISDEEMAGGSL